MAIETQMDGRSECPTLALPHWKRAMDLVLAGGTLLVASPIMLLIAILNRLFLGRGVVFRNLRGGYGGSTFELYKFRTMTDDRSPNGELLPDEQRTHWWGDILRASSLDELPGLLNVLQGEMSVVGPRPLIARYLERYSPEQALRHRLRPGLTGLAQISGRNLVGWEDRFDLDNRYIDQLSVRQDVRILVRTVGQVVRRTGADGNAHAVEFMGSN